MPKPDKQISEQSAEINAQINSCEPPKIRVVIGETKPVAKEEKPPATEPVITQTSIPCTRAE